MGVGKEGTVMSPLHTFMKISQPSVDPDPLEVGKEGMVKSPFQISQPSLDPDPLEVGKESMLKSPLHTFTKISQPSVDHDPSSSIRISHQPHPTTVITQQDNTTCSDKRCTNLLSPASYRVYKKCERRVIQKKNITDADIPYNCVFRDGKKHDPVALVSLPGSGNTWVRGLLEKATGICTGSIYCDGGLMRSGFVGETVHDGSVLVAKAHTPDYKKSHTKYGSAILLIRNPFDAMVAERNRQNSGGNHVGELSISSFGK